MTPPPPRSLLDTLANPYLLLVLTTLFWGLNVVVGRSAVGSEMPPVALTFWRWFLAILLLMPFAGPALWRQRSIVRRHWKILL
ncbi:MAG TPA: EamA family transporter, partial [Alphaproteobacteria bacterium]|nr:EamA family transporter [Alphaproteobacteria bacterium]